MAIFWFYCLKTLQPIKNGYLHLICTGNPYGRSQPVIFRML
ncbi:hypothetical protein OIU76_003929 [Salix suchowensis]|nr:hypothetical protein OIU76_003929 [Salix suchowensis]